MMTTATPVAVCLKLTQAINQTRTVEEIYTIALDALADGLAVSRSAILLFDASGVMRFAAWRHISDDYRLAVEGHTPWRPDTPNPEPLVVADVTLEPSLAGLLPTIEAEGIAAMAFIPLVGLDRVIGKFMLYYDQPYLLSSDDLQLACVIASQVAFALERTQAEAQARRSEAAAAEASRLKDEFLATLSHELRTPLNAIFGWVQMLQKGVSPERLRHAIDVIGRNTTLQARLIEDILDVSRIISGKLEIELTPVLLAPLIDTVVNGVLPAAQAKSIELVKTAPADLPVIDGDPKRLHQVFGNVLSNAVKFTPNGGRIDVRCTVEGDVIAIDVQDSGVGIAREFLPFVFERFRQADSRSIRRHGGLGLGLAIARHLVEQHHGEIHATSAGPGLGTTVHIRLPVSTETTTHLASLHAPAALEPDGESRMHGTTVLVVDDQPDSCELLAALFERQGARVVQCDSAESALGVLNDVEANLLIADIAMPDVDGYELIRRVRATHPTLPAIAVSAYAHPQDRRRALGAGYDGYCAKPVETPQLLRIVRDVMLAS